MLQLVLILTTYKYIVKIIFFDYEHVYLYIFVYLGRDIVIVFLPLQMIVYGDVLCVIGEKCSLKITYLMINIQWYIYLDQVFM